MHKTELAEAIAQRTGLSKVDATNAIEAFISITTDTLKKGDVLTLIGFGSFKVTKRAARVGRNPQTGKEVEIPEKNVPKFSAGKALKEEVN